MFFTVRINFSNDISTKKIDYNKPWIGIIYVSVLDILVKLYCGIRRYKYPYMHSHLFYLHFPTFAIIYTMPRFIKILIFKNVSYSFI